MKANIIAYPIKAQKILNQLNDLRSKLLMSHDWKACDVLAITDECIGAIDIITRNVRTAFKDMDIENEHSEENDNRQLG